MSGSAILAAFFGAMVFGRIADVYGRKAVYTVVAAIMIVGAVASAHQPFTVHLRGTGTFRPITEVVFVTLAIGISDCERLAGAIVGAGGEPLGIVSSADLARELKPATPVSRIMSETVHTVARSTTGSTWPPG